MSGGGKTFLFILLLPFLAALGHDVYYSYLSDDDKIKKVERLQIDPKEFLPSDLGWLWHEHSPGTMQTARDSIEEDVWNKKINPVLQYPSMVIALMPFLIGVIFCIFSRILGVWPFSENMGSLSKKRKNSDSVYKHAKSKAMKYSRK